MTQITRRNVALALMIAGGFAAAVRSQEVASEPKCKEVHADLVEDRSTTECRPGHTVCFLGQVDGNHGLRGTTYFHGEASVATPPQSPGWRAYSGFFEYTTSRGILTMRETGVTNPTTGNPESGGVTAFQQITGATGEFEGVTGHFFVSGFNINNHVVTQVTGQLCYP
jgi:hypothetical protein